MYIFVDSFFIKIKYIYFYELTSIAFNKQQISFGLYDQSIKTNKMGTNQFNQTEMEMEMEMKTETNELNHQSKNNNLLSYHEEKKKFTFLLNTFFVMDNNLKNNYNQYLEKTNTTVINVYNKHVHGEKSVNFCKKMGEDSIVIDDIPQWKKEKQKTNEHKLENNNNHTFFKCPYSRCRHHDFNNSSKKIKTISSFKKHVIGKHCYRRKQQHQKLKTNLGNDRYYGKNRCPILKCNIDFRTKSNDQKFKHIILMHIDLILVNTLEQNYHPKNSWDKYKKESEFIKKREYLDKILYQSWLINK